MGIIDRFRALLSGPQDAAEERSTHFIYIYLPETLEPDEREARYGDPLNAELQLADVGFVSGGGSLLGAPDDDGNRTMVYAGVDVGAYDLDAARAVLRDHLPSLGCVVGTRLDFDDHGAWEDCYTAEGWAIRQPQTPYDEREIA